MQFPSSHFVPLAILLCTPQLDAQQVSAESSGLAWIENQGQWSCDARFVARLPDMLLRAGPDSLGLQTFDQHGDATSGTYLRWTFENASSEAMLVPQSPKSALHSWFVGNDPDRWIRGLHEFGELRWRGLYPGIDMVLHDRFGSVEYDLEVAAGVDLSQVRIHCEGQERIELDAEGALGFTTSDGRCTQRAPIIFERSGDGSLRPIEGCIRLLDDHTFGFEVERRDLTASLVIDPSLTWSTFFGGGTKSLGGFDIATSVGVDAAGDIYVAGNSAALDFPSTPGAYHFPTGAGNNCFAAKFRGIDGALTYSAIFGGTHALAGGPDNDRCRAIKVDKFNRVIVAGDTNSVDFPSTPGSFDPTYASNASAGFAIELSPNGSQLLWGTFLEGGGPTVTGLDLDSAGAPVVVGFASSGYPTTQGAFNVSNSGDDDGFITKLDPTGSFLQWSTYLGGVFPDRPKAVCLDDQDRVTITGETQSIDFPTTPGAYSTTYLGSIGAPNIFVSRLAPQGNALLWSTFFSGSSLDFVFGMGLLRDNGVVIAGSTFSHDLPVTAGAIGQTYTGGYAARFDTTGSSLLYCTYLASSGIIEGRGLAVDGSGIVTLIGQADGGSTMTPGAFDTSSNGGLDVSLIRLNPSGTKMYYGTYLGGVGEDDSKGIVTTPTGRLTVEGRTVGSWCGRKIW